MKNKNIKSYLQLPYTRELLPEPEGGWFVRIKELPGCMSQGETPQEAITQIEEALVLWLEAALEANRPIPEPKPDADFSGKFIVRLPKSLHRKAVEQAEMEGVSLNQWVLSVVAEAVGQERAIQVNLSTKPLSAAIK
jgi:predicted RNase H-like HicB family nuclease